MYIPLFTPPTSLFYSSFPLLSFLAHPDYIIFMFDSIVRIVGAPTTVSAMSAQMHIHHCFPFAIWCCFFASSKFSTPFVASIAAALIFLSISSTMSPLSFTNTVISFNNCVS